MIDQKFIGGDHAEKFILNGIAMMPGGFFIYRADDTEELVYANQALLDLFECDDFQQFFELTGGKFTGTVFYKDAADVEKNIAEQINISSDHFDHVDYRIRTKNGKIEYIAAYGRKVENPDEGSLYYVFIVDARARYSAFDTDELTGLLGRRQFLSNITMRIDANRRSEEPEKYSFAYINLTEFKALNVRYGVAAGDNVLRNFAEILHAVFSDECISRFSDDHFVICSETDEITEKLDALNELFIEKKLNEMVGLKVGIYHLDDDEITPAVACDLAKYASDYIKNDERSYFCEYHPGIEQKTELENYLIRNLDNAIKRGHIKVYYQPVLRTLTGDLCGKEALCRWLDPERGFISPADFIPVLEKSKIIHKLDNFIVKQVCKDLRDELKDGGAAVPVSFNLSRLDFSLGNPFETVEAQARKYDIPREYLRVEITETTLMDNPEKVRSEIEKFHSVGYQVWMDDFGSGFSSLNILKDFDFDEIKVDMLFLSSFNERSKTIIRHTIMMAKELGIKTLAEGVETEEQYIFLKNIGCQKIQGSYAGVPMLSKDIKRSITERKIKVETAEERRYFTQVGKVNVITDSALALLEDDGKNFKFYFINDAYMKALSTMGTMSVSQAEANLNARGSMMGKIYRNYALQVEMVGEETVFIYMDRGQSMRLVATPVAQSQHKYMLKLELENLHIESESERQHAIDTYIRCLMYVYDSADILHLDEDYAEALMREGSFTNFGTRLYGLEEIRSFFASRVVHGDDYERYHAFSDPKTLADRIRATGKGYIRDEFRFKNTDGNYEWKTALELLLPNSDKDVVIQFIRDSGEPFGHRISEEHDNLLVFWDTLMKNTDIRYCWKDKDSRYMGANKAFLDFYGIGSVDDIRGKRDDEIVWNDSVIQQYEEEHKKAFSTDHGYKNIHLLHKKDGAECRMIASKYPVYEDAELVGYLGAFEEENPKYNKIRVSLDRYHIDALSGLMNVQAAYETELKLYENYTLQKHDFAVAELEITKLDKLIKDNNESVANELLRIVGSKIRDHMSRSEMAARVDRSRFVILSDSSDHNYVLKLVQDTVADVQGISEVMGRKVRLTVNHGIVFASETSDVENMNRIVARRRMEFAEKHEDMFAKRIENEKTPSSRELSLFYKLPVAVVVFRLIFDADRTKVTDAEYVYVNERYCRAVRKEENELIGKTFLSTIKNADSFWGPYCYRAVMDKIELHDRTYSRETGYWTEFTVSPSTLHDCCMITFMNIDGDLEQMESISKNVTTDDRIIRVARLLISNEPYNDKMNMVLEELSHMLHPDRLYILEQDDKYISNTFEWCAEGVEPEIDTLQNLDKNEYKGWEELLNYDTCINIPDVEEIKDVDKLIYDTLRRQYINRLIAVPLYDNGKLIGYLGADNYEFSRALDTRRLLETAAAFIASKIASHHMLCELNKAKERKEKL